MIIDDSLTARTVLTRILQRETDVAVVATAASAEQGLAILQSTPVDIVLLDLEMPGMGGLEALPQILRSARGAQVLVVSSLTAQGAEATLQALKMGAADTMLKPRTGGFDDAYRGSLLGKIRALGSKARRRGIGPVPDCARPLARPKRPKRPQVVAIGASTGGIHALNRFLQRIPRDFSLPILITQHLPASFIAVFAKQVEAAAGREAVLAGEGTAVRAGGIVIAPGHGHMMVRRQRDAICTRLAYHAVKSGCRPSVDPMFGSLADAYDGHVAAVLLSGMGRDGTEGAEQIAAAGGGIYAQSEESCAVWGMPRSVTEAGLAWAVAPPEVLAAKVVAAAGDAAWQ